MENQSNSTPEDSRPTEHKLEAFLWICLTVLVMAVLLVLGLQYREKIRSLLRHSEIADFNEVQVTNNTHDFSVANGPTWNVTYETGIERNFAGLVRHTSAINEPSFAILTFDILVTSGEFSDPALVQTSVVNHHFSWTAPSLSNPAGSINLLHTLPLNDDINQQLESVAVGDTVIIRGYDIDKIDGYDSSGNYLGFWQDSGCNTLLVTGVEILR